MKTILVEFKGNTGLFNYDLIYCLQKMAIVKSLTEIGTRSKTVFCRRYLSAPSLFWSDCARYKY